MRRPAEHIGCAVREIGEDPRPSNRVICRPMIVPRRIELHAIVG
jgi:hypothetical protein